MKVERNGEYWPVRGLGKEIFETAGNILCSERHYESRGCICSLVLSRTMPFCLNTVEVNDGFN